MAIFDLLKLDSSKQNIWFTSDTHFGHANIIKYCKRPFANADEMNEALIKNWNDVVKEEDIVFHLGDFAFGGSNLWNSVLDRLNGQIHLILGNHDVKNIRDNYMERFASISFQKMISIDGHLIYLNHYPFLCYGGAYRQGEDAVLQLFGHVHSSPIKYDINHINDQEVKEILGKDDERLQYLFKTQYDVGVDNNNYAPISWETIKTKLLVK